jgi:hypothetical protein
MNLARSKEPEERDVERLMDLLVLGLFLDIFPQVCLARAPPSGERDHAVVCISKQLNQLLLRLFERQGLSLLELASWRHVESGGTRQQVGFAALSGEASGLKLTFAFIDDARRCLICGPATGVRQIRRARRQC